jgi:hypothetical protein
LVAGNLLQRYAEKLDLLAISVLMNCCLLKSRAMVGTKPHQPIFSRHASMVFWENVQIFVEIQNRRIHNKLLQTIPGLISSNHYFDLQEIKCTFKKKQEMVYTQFNSL